MSDVIIANLAAGFLGDEATISGLTPPEGSAQSEHAAQFYPIARDAVLEMHTWGFATRRATLSLRDETVNGWVYSYDRPSEALKVFSVMPQSATDDLVVVGGVKVPQKFTTEIAANGDQIILTNQQNADCRFVTRVTDTTKFTPLFQLCVAKLLASFMAGPIYKGKTGVAMSAEMLGHFQLFFNQAIMNAGTETHEDVEHPTTWER